MYQFPSLATLYARIRRPAFVLDLVAQRHRVLVFGRGCVQRVGHAILLALAEVVHQQVAGDGGDPGHEGAALDVVGTQRTEHLDEDFLGKILGVVARTGEAIADVVDAPVVALHDFLPGHYVAGYAATDQHSNDLASSNPHSPELLVCPPDVAQAGP